MLAAIYDPSGRVVAEGEAVTDPATGRTAKTIVLDGHRDAGPVEGVLIGVSGGLARYDLVGPATPDTETEAEAKPKRRRTTAATEEGQP